MATQLRVYTINRGQLQQFTEEWKHKILPLRMQHGFQVGGAWTIEATNQFVWLLSYGGPEAWEEKDQAYYSSAEREAMDPNPARLIARAEHYIVERVL
jgi:hypothetical protein